MHWYKTYHEKKQIEQEEQKAGRHTTKKFDKPSVMPLISRPMPMQTSSSHAAEVDFICIGGT